jgi:protein-S-isoprenylcysteine O-methyltransferase Ste14
MSSSRSARAAFFFGVLATLAIPAGVVAAQYLNGVALLRALYFAVPAACVLALVAVVCARRARFSAARSVRGGSARTARVVAWTGMYAGVTGALALAVYGALRWAQ